jgi:dolichyl-phosphate-mannose-protein mannosyltransferase
MQTEPIHPYCSPWWSWLLTLRSISYFYEELPNGEMVRDVTALGNPFLYWLSAIAMLLLCNYAIAASSCGHTWKVDL